MTHHTLLLSRKNVCRHANQYCYMKYMNDCRPSGNLELRLQRLMRIDQRLMKERPGSLSSRDRRWLSVISFCLSLPRVCFAHRQSCEISCRARKGWHIHLYDSVSLHVCYIERCCLICVIAELPHIQLGCCFCSVSVCVCVRATITYFYHRYKSVLTEY